VSEFGIEPETYRLQYQVLERSNLMRRAMVMTLYSTGIRCSELCHLKVSDIDSERMVIRVHKGTLLRAENRAKGGFSPGFVQW
jgi:integrase